MPTEDYEPKNFHEALGALDCARKLRLTTWEFNDKRSKDQTATITRLEHALGEIFSRTEGSRYSAVAELAEIANEALNPNGGTHETQRQD
jgi:hypothetical protein